MAELDVAAVARFTQGRLAADAQETARLLGLALGAARAWCRWHVTPVRPVDPFTLDGSGWSFLRLPTLKLVTLDSLSEEGVAVNTETAIDLSADRTRAYRRNGGRWSCRPGAIAGTMTHGYEACPEFDQVVLQLLDRASFAPEGGRARVIGPIQYESTGAAGPFTREEQGYLNDYRLSLPT